jgi:hypothetical protein
MINFEYIKKIFAGAGLNIGNEIKLGMDEMLRSIEDSKQVDKYFGADKIVEVIGEAGDIENDLFDYMNTLGIRFLKEKMKKVIGADAVVDEAEFCSFGY